MANEWGTNLVGRQTNDHTGKDISFVFLLASKLSQYSRFPNMVLSRMFDMGVSTVHKQISSYLEICNLLSKADYSTSKLSLNV